MYKTRISSITAQAFVMDKLILLVALLIFLACSKTEHYSIVSAPAEPLAITTVSPDRAEAGAILSITGVGFSTEANKIQVKIGSFVGIIKSSSATQLVVTLPPGITNGTYDITVISSGRSVTKQNGFYLVDWIVTTLAGTGNRGGTDGNGDQATFTDPSAIVADANKNLYVTDGNKIRKITPAGFVSTYAGSNERGATDGDALAARFSFPTNIAIDINGNLYVADGGNNMIRKVSTAGLVTTIAGKTTAGNNNGKGPEASFNMSGGIAVNQQGTILYVGDFGNNLIRKIDLATFEVTSYAGNGTATSSDGNGLNAGIAKPGGIFLNTNGDLYVTEHGGKIRKVTTSGTVSTVGGTMNVNNIPSNLVLDPDQNMYVVFAGMNIVKKFTSAGESNFFGNISFPGDKNGPAGMASFLYPEGITMVTGADGKVTFYICDTGNNKIKQITKG